MDGSATGLPASIELAWGLRSRPRKGPKGELSLRRIVEAGLRVVRADGLAAVSMARVAAELGASTMSLYRYVAAKDELLDLMGDAAIGPPPAPAPGESWRGGMSRWAWAERAVLQRDPWWLRIPIRGLPTTPNQVAWLDAALRSLDGTGLAPNERMSVVLLVTSFVQAEVDLGTGVAEAFAAAGQRPQEAMSAYGRTLAAITDPADYPGLHGVIDAGVFDAEDGPDDEFAFGIERILDGVEALIETRKR